MSNRWVESQKVPRGEHYDAQFAALEQSGRDVHGEATFVASLGVRRILDAGCGTGRVAIELARRGYEVVGVDIDPAMLAAARRKAPTLPWYEGDIATCDIDDQRGGPERQLFEVIVMAGNVMIFLRPGTEAAVLANMTRHLQVGGKLVAGFQLLPASLTLAHYDALATQAGLELVERWATWDRRPWSVGCDYAVSVHRRCRMEHLETSRA